MIRAIAWQKVSQFLIYLGRGNTDTIAKLRFNGCSNGLRTSINDGRSEVFDDFGHKVKTSRDG